ncbi:Hypothetical protein SCF082_LOCUS17375 [Durusdinium trenchii]|uniref:Uncharacterized protein n=1 Tax=Durusdinium trenchii TaxID=1381693 RepID=A0ABP0KHR8_9DINO
MAAHKELLKMLQSQVKSNEEMEKSRAKQVSELLKKPSRKVVSNDSSISPPKNLTILDNTLLFLPENAVRELSLEPNMNDKGDEEKYMWVGRVWELRTLLMRFSQEKVDTISKDSENISEFRKRELKTQMKDPEIRAKLKRFAARWRGSAQRLRCSFSVLERLKYSHLRGTLIYAHGSGGCSWDNYRICRMIAAMGILVIAPDGFAYPKETAMGQMRHKSLMPLHKSTSDVDYWANDLLYTSSAWGTFNYSSKADSVLKDPQEYKDIYEKCYQLRRSELHFIIARLPKWVLAQGFFLGGTSEGAMTVTRFDDQRYGDLIIGRFINSFSMEYCYFTPEPEAALLGGRLDIPTLNIIGTKDQYFGPVDSVAKIVADNGGCGDRFLTGNGFKTMVRQGVDLGLVCVLEGGVHSPCNTHDNFLRPLFNAFFSRTGSIWELHRIWQADSTLRSLVQLAVETTASEEAKGKRVTLLMVPNMKFPNHMTLKEIEVLRTHEVAAERLKEQAIMQAQEGEIKELLQRTRAEAAKLSSRTTSSHNYYARDKLAIKCDWSEWLRKHSNS